jgi:Holliday junction DNA helicase RuvA
MIGRLTGKVVAQEDEYVIVVEVGGVGYEVQSPLGTVGRAKVDDLGCSTLFVHTHVREEAFTLYGFASDAERLAFRTLIGVSNVGPKTAMAVLSALPADELARAIATKDVTRLTKISGVGKKTAERLVLELRDKLPIFAAHQVPAVGSALGAARATPRGGLADLLESALANMSFRPAEIERALAHLAPKLAHDEPAPLPELIRDALAILAK